MRKFDLIVIGSGPAGISAAVQARQLCRSVAIIERRTAIGGVCLHTGTIPSKTLREAVLYLTGYRQRTLYGASYRLKPDLAIEDLTKRLHITIEHEIEVTRNQLLRHGVEIFEGTASLRDKHKVVVMNSENDKTVYEADKILIATGTRPIQPADIPFDNQYILDSDGILKLQRLPRSMIVVGSGVIGLEYASLFSALDIRVTLVDAREKMMPFMDSEIIDEFIHYLRKNHVTLRMGEAVTKIAVEGASSVVTSLDSGKQINTELALFAAGRIGCTDALNLDKVGLKADEKHRLKVNKHYQTSISNIYAAGDVIGFPSLASTSMEQGRLAVCHAFGKKSAGGMKMFPFAIYAVPEMSMIGQTENELTKNKIPYYTGKAHLRETSRGQILGIGEGVLKMLFAEEGDKLLGVHILGEGSSELIHIGQAVLAMGGTIDYFLEHVFNYPTLAEAYKVAALDAWNNRQVVSCPIPEQQ
ncbi:MAG: Si-specific NAD(P)(+) transhydrogenase [Magnetococcales bacterium]|nr:Si-specific NAD(P)(+) transhydrogenase [Magnetococcales bacterium]